MTPSVKSPKRIVDLTGDKPVRVGFGAKPRKIVNLTAEPPKVITSPIEGTDFSDADLLAVYQQLSGERRAAFFKQRTVALWRAFAAQISRTHT